MAGLGHFPSQQVNVCSPWAPVALVEESDTIGFESILIVYQAFSEQPDGRVTCGELVEELRRGHYGIWKKFLPDFVARRSLLVARALVGCGEELAAFGVENGGDCLDVRILSVYVVGCIGGNYVECIDSDDLYSIGQVHCLCEGYCYAEASEAAWADSDVDLVDILGLSAGAVQQGADGREELRAVSHRAGEGGFGKQLSSKCYCDGTCSAGGFNG